MPYAPLSLHPDNPHYLLFRDKPATLITSGEHYGAVMNADFDYIPYLDTLAACEFNQTRLFSGTYRELPGSHGIQNNTMAPKPERYLCPWRCVERGPEGEPLKWDLRQWDDDYWTRLRDFVAEAGARGIVVEYVLFCMMYNDTLWQASPMHPDNSVNALPPCDRHGVYLLENTQLLTVQEALVHKAAGELNEFDNVYFEITNEPYFVRDAAAMRAWQHRMVDVLVNAERDLPNRHLIAMNYENRVARIADPHPAVSLLNFHYAATDAVAWNYHLDLPLADDETGFLGATPTPYRTEAWSFMLSGGAIFSHLDYSYTPAHPDGTGDIVGTTPGHGGPAWRAQLTALKRFLDGFDLLAMAPQPAAAKASNPFHVKAAVLAEEGQAYAVYLWGQGSSLDVRIPLPPGNYEATWVNPADGRVLKLDAIAEHAGGEWVIKSPIFMEDVALKVVRTGG